MGFTSTALAENGSTLEQSIPSDGATSAASPRRIRFSNEDYFGPQRTSTAALPDVEPLLVNLANGVMEVLAGVRGADQLARWLVADAYRALVVRANLASRSRSARGIVPARPVVAVSSVRHSSPADGIVEGVVIVSTPHRVRAIAMRLEGTDGRWRATSLALL